MQNQDRIEPHTQRQRLRAIRFLRGGTASSRPAAQEGRVLLQNSDGGTIALHKSVLDGLKRDGILTCKDDGQVMLSDVGEARGRRDEAATEPFRAQHWQIEHRSIMMTRGRQDVTANLAESPLGQLARRRTRSGEPFLTQAEFDAGERLRSDYTRGQIMPRLSANWVATVSAGKRGSGPGGAAQLTEAALSARQRVDRALVAIGPELAGVLVDICCFLKGFEQVETERGWPVRSAKVVLKTALGALDRHYDPRSGGSGTRNRPILHWGAEDYRPRVA
nr:DUF6456 domain-containing protein [Nitratireductor soli]